MIRKVFMVVLSFIVFGFGVDRFLKSAYGQEKKTISKKEVKQLPAKKREVYESKIQKRDDLVYVVNETTPYTGSVLSKYENGQIKLKIYCKNGKVDGEYISYYENGQIRQKGNFKDGEKDGEWITFSEYGEVKETEKYYGARKVQIEKEIGKLKDKLQKIQGTSKILCSAISIFYGYHEGEYPKSLQELVPKYLDKIPDGNWNYNPQTGEVKSKAVMDKTAITRKKEEINEITEKIKELAKERERLKSKKEIQSELRGNLGTLRSSLAIFYGDTEGKYPKSLEELVPKYIWAIPAGDWQYNTETGEVNSKSHPDW